MKIYICTGGAVISGVYVERGPIDQVPEAVILDMADGRDLAEWGRVSNDHGYIRAEMKNFTSPRCPGACPAPYETPDPAVRPETRPDPVPAATDGPTDADAASGPAPAGRSHGPHERAGTAEKPDQLASIRSSLDIIRGALMTGENK